VRTSHCAGRRRLSESRRVRLVERANGELKAETGLRSDLVLRDPGDAGVRIDAALRWLYHRRRSSRGGRTAAELDATLPRAETIVDRDTFWRAARYNIARAVKALTPRVLDA
jgi:hypothetical protein